MNEVETLYTVFVHAKPWFCLSTLHKTFFSVLFFMSRNKFHKQQNSFSHHKEQKNIDFVIFFGLDTLEYDGCLRIMDTTGFFKKIFCSLYMYERVYSYIIVVCGSGLNIRRISGGVVASIIFAIYLL